MSGTATVRFDVDDLDQWGRLVKSWATHLDYVTARTTPDPPRDYWVNTSWPGEKGKTPATTTVLDADADGNPKPWCLPPGGPVLIPTENGGSVALPFAIAMTAGQFEQRLTAAKVKVTGMPPKVANIVVVQGGPETLVFRLPPKDILQGSEDDLIISGVDYPIPAFYGTLYKCPPTFPKTQTDIMELHAYRIGEYTLNNCA